MKTIVFPSFLALGLFFASVVAYALPVGIGLGIDGSGSITSNEFALQRDAYADALDTLIPIDGSVAIGVWQFSSNVQQEFSFTTIDSQSDKDNLLMAINNMVQLDAATNIAGTIDTISNAMITFGLDNLSRAVIDISTDGLATAGGTPSISANNAIANGIDQVNCLGIGGSFDCGFIAGTDAFSISVDNFEDIETALVDKLERELDKSDPTPAPIPEPASLLLLVTGMGGIAITRKKTLN